MQRHCRCEECLVLINCDDDDNDDNDDSDDDDDDDAGVACSLKAVNRRRHGPTEDQRVANCCAGTPSR